MARGMAGALQLLGSTKQTGTSFMADGMCVRTWVCIHAWLHMCSLVF